MGYCKKRQKLRIIATLTFLICGLLGSQFSYGQQLNKQIDKSQKTAISSSPFKTAKGMYKELSRQKRIRLEYLTLIDSLRKEFPKDTILLTENYDFICFGCPADYIQIQIGDKLISLRKDFQSKKYETKTEKLSKLYFAETGYFHTDIYELRKEISYSDNWNKNPAKYGTENCFDGGHTFYSFIYPDGKIISMYMRCWINKEMRKTNE
jgi:hypothetical protein